MRYVYPLDKALGMSGSEFISDLLSEFIAKLSVALQALSSIALPGRYAEEIEIKISAASIPLREGKGYNGFHKMGVPASVPFLKDTAALRPV